MPHTRTQLTDYLIHHDYILPDSANRQLDPQDKKVVAEIIGLHNSGKKYTLKSCSRCNKKKRHHVKYNDLEMCQTCFDSIGYICDYCGGYKPNPHTHKDGMKKICSACFERHYAECQHCSKVLKHTQAYSLDGNDYCRICYEMMFVACNDCGVSLRRGTAEVWFIANRSYCRDCYTDRTNRVRLHEYSYKPDPRFFGKIKPRQGLELETEGKVQLLGNVIDHDYQYLKSDCTLDDGAEIVSHPASFDWLKENPNKWDNILDLSSKGLTSYRGGNCGIHIHLDKDSFTTFHLYKFQLFLLNNESFVKTISQRTNSRIDNWAKITNPPDYNIKRRAKNKYSPDRRTALNLQNHYTAEFRIFRGTLNKRSFWKNIEFTDALFYFTRDTEPRKLTQNHFIDYCNRLNQYNNLNSWMQERIA